MITKIIGLICWVGTALCGWSLYSLVRMLIDGIVEQNLWLLIGGGLLLYVFLGLLFVGMVVTFVVGYVVISGWVE